MARFFYLETIEIGYVDHDLMANIWEKAISILAGSLNSGRIYLIKTVHYDKTVESRFKRDLNMHVLKTFLTLGF